MRAFGWTYMMVIDSLDGVINPRPIIVEAHKQNKTGILHYVLGDRKSACGNANFKVSFLDHNHKNVCFQDPYDQNNINVKCSLICPECETYFKNNQEINTE